jgi:hypothetical protein
MKCYFGGSWLLAATVEYHEAELFGVRCWVSKSTRTRPQRWVKPAAHSKLSIRDQAWYPVTRLPPVMAWCTALRCCSRNSSGHSRRLADRCPGVVRDAVFSDHDLGRPVLPSQPGERVVETSRIDLLPACGGDRMRLERLPLTVDHNR